MLNNYIKEKKKEKDILLMTHQVLNYPDFKTNEAVLDVFSKNGVDLVELQIPFSEPTADGPLFLKANQVAVEKNVSIDAYFDFIEKMIKKYNFPIMIMTYYNIVFHYGIFDFMEKAKSIGVAGLIVPDIPIDYGPHFYDIARSKQLDAVPIATAYSSDERLKKIGDSTDAFVYYVPRSGVTGTKTEFTDEMIEHLKKARKTIGKPMAVGFGIQDKKAIDALIGASDIAIIGSKVLSLLEEGGLKAVDEFFKQLQLGGKSND